MGWTSCNPSYYVHNNAIDRKRTCDSYFESPYNHNFQKVLKSTMVGSVYYAAVEQQRAYATDSSGNRIKDTHGNYVIHEYEQGNRPVRAYVFRTAIKDGEFFYKDMSEDEGPCYYDCPESILSLLTKPDNAYAQEWRDKCRSEAKLPKLKDLAYGAKITYKTYDGTVMILQKQMPNHQFKKSWWSIVGSDHRYMPKTRIPRHFTVL